MNKILVELILFRNELQNINKIAIDGWYIENYNEKVTKLETITNCNLNIYKIDQNELDEKPIYGFAYGFFDANSTTTVNIEDNYSQNLLFEKSKLIIKLDALLLFFREELKKINLTKQ